MGRWFGPMLQGMNQRDFREICKRAFFVRWIRKTFRERLRIHKLSLGTTIRDKFWENPILAKSRVFVMSPMWLQKHFRSNFELCEEVRNGKFDVNNEWYFAKAWNVTVCSWANDKSYFVHMASISHRTIGNHYERCSLGPHASKFISTNFIAPPYILLL